jgi:hypothetical protein
LNHASGENYCNQNTKYGNCEGEAQMEICGGGIVWEVLGDVLRITMSFALKLKEKMGFEIENSMGALKRNRNMLISSCETMLMNENIIGNIEKLRILMFFWLKTFNCFNFHVFDAPIDVSKLNFNVF